MKMRLVYREKPVFVTVNLVVCWKSPTFDHSRLSAFKSAYGNGVTRRADAGTCGLSSEDAVLAADEAVLDVVLVDVLEDVWSVNEDAQSAADRDRQKDVQL